MTTRTLCVTKEIHDYLMRSTLREPEILRRLREETARDEMARMEIAPEQGQFMTLLLHLIGARKTLEIGVYTGYSSLITALALPEDGRLVACDISRKWTDVARRYWQEAGVADKIDLRLGPAADTLAGLQKEGRADSFDFAFIDADKSNYDEYYEQCLKLLRPGGLIAIDNTLWDGAVADPEIDDEDTLAIRALNLKLRDDPRVDFALVPVADGLGLAWKRGGEG
jgi:predicted O-methyltransferase YrrM